MSHICSQLALLTNEFLTLLIWTFCDGDTCFPTFHTMFESCRVWARLQVQTLQTSFDDDNDDSHVPNPDSVFCRPPLFLFLCQVEDDADASFTCRWHGDKPRIYSGKRNREKCLVYQK